MRGNVEAVKERVDIAEVIGGYIQLQKAGANLKAKCPFHNEKTASFFISPSRQSYYCFGCGAKGDVFTFVQEMDGLDFKGALRLLAERAGVEISYERGESKDKKDRLYQALEDATLFFESNLSGDKEACEYLKSRGLTSETVKEWRLGYAPSDWRLLRNHMHGIGYDDETLLKAGLIKQSEDHKEKEPYDIFRGRIIFPLKDPRGQVIAFSGRALGKDTEPKYLNTPDTPLFTKSEVLYGLDKAREEIRRKDYAVLVEGQMDLVLSHQANVNNTVASSGTAFTATHLERLKRLSSRIILAFDGDSAGMKASEKSTALALALGLEVKVARLPAGKDPADLAYEGEGEAWREALRNAKPAIEVFLEEILSSERDHRKIGKAIEKKLLPYLVLVGSAIERSHYLSLIAKRTGIKEEILLEDLKKAKSPASLSSDLSVKSEDQSLPAEIRRNVRSREEELLEVLAWLKENPEDKNLIKHEKELRKHLRIDELDAQITLLRMELARGDEGALEKINLLGKELDEEKRKVL